MLINELGQEKRIYVGQKNVTKSGKACLGWADVEHEYSEYEGIGDHKYCRNPGRSQKREWCFYSPTEYEDCGARTCGKI